MNLDDLLSQTCPWLRGGGEESDIVIACQIRLTRNLVGFPFPVRASEQDRRSVQDTVKKAVAELYPEEEYIAVDVQTLSPLDRDFLWERQLISKEVVKSECPHTVFVNGQERFCAVVNDEDHLRIQSAGSGLQTQPIWELLNQIDDQFSGKLDYVFHEKYGFLTSRATYAGTGMKINVILHLPGLVVTSEMDKVARSLSKKNLVISGFYGEGSQIHGDLFQVSNRITLGKSEDALNTRMNDLVPQIVEYERQARGFLLKNRREIILDRCNRALGVLRTARTISNVEAMRHLSSIRLGIHMGLLGGLDIATVNLLFLHIQPAHLQKMHGISSSQADQDVDRATYIRLQLGV